MKVTETLARYTLETSIRSFPQDVVHQGKRCFLDFWGVALCGSKQPLSRILGKMAKEFGGKPQATVLGQGFKTSILNAALINGAMAHALDYDDTHLGTLSHPSAPVIPAALAIAEWKHLSGKAALEAFVLGFEVETRIGLGMGAKHYQRGWHATSTFGRFGAAVAAGKLLKLSLQEMTQAIGLAGTQASGLRIVFGTMAKPFHPGKAAYDGVLSAILAQRGFTCAPNILEGKKGYVEVLGEADAKLAPMIRNMGEQYEILNNTFKPHASCLATHPTIDAVIALRNKYSLQSEDVEEIQCAVSPLCMDAAGQLEPKTGLAGKFSVYYCAALAMAEGVAGEDMFTDKRILNPQMIGLRKKVKIHVVSKYKGTDAKVTITTKRGEKYSASINVPKGDPRNPLTDKELEDKFRSLANSVLPKQKIEFLVERLWNLETVKDLNRLLRLAH